MKRKERDKRLDKRASMGSLMNGSPTEIIDPWNVTMRNFKIGKIIGKGSYAKVRLARNKINT